MHARIANLRTLPHPTSGIRCPPPVHLVRHRVENHAGRALHVDGRVGGPEGHVVSYTLHQSPYITR